MMQVSVLDSYVIEIEKFHQMKMVYYIRKIDSFKKLREISILDKWTAGVYSKSKGFVVGAVAEAEKKVEKFVERKAREKQIASDEQKLQELKQYIVKQKNNEII